MFKTRKTSNNLVKGKEKKKLHSPARNWTRVFCTTGEDTHYYTTYTTEDCLLGLSCKNMYFMWTLKAELICTLYTHESMKCEFSATGSLLHFERGNVLKISSGMIYKRLPHAAPTHKCTVWNTTTNNWQQHMLCISSFTWWSLKFTHLAVSQTHTRSIRYH